LDIGRISAGIAGEVWLIKQAEHLFRLDRYTSEAFIRACRSVCAEQANDLAGGLPDVRDQSVCPILPQVVDSMMLMPETEPVSTLCQ